MKVSTIIIISGLPASGKTTIGNYLSKELKIPLYSKDQFKEMMYDIVGWKDKTWDDKINRTSLDIIYTIIADEVEIGRSIMVEGNFRVEVDKARFQKLMDQYHFRVVEIVCEADNEILWERFKKRAESGNRHPGHRDKENLKAMKEGILTAKAKPLGLGKVIRVNTEETEKVDFKQLAHEVDEDVSNK